MHRIWRTAPAAALALTLAATGCSRDLPRGSGGESPRSGTDGATLGAAEDAEPLDPYEPKHGSTPRGTDEVYEEILSALDWAYEELGDPQPGYDSMSRVQNTAARQLSGEAFDWPSGTSYSLSVLDEDLTENFCTNNENVEQFLKLIDQERKGATPPQQAPPEPQT